MAVAVRDRLVPLNQLCQIATPQQHTVTAPGGLADSPLCAVWRCRHGLVVESKALWQQGLLLASIPGVYDACMKLHRRDQCKASSRVQVHVLLPGHLSSLQQCAEPKLSVVDVLHTKNSAAAAAALEPPPDEPQDHHTATAQLVPVTAQG